MNFDIPTPEGPHRIQLDEGSTTTFCGANGSGKTRLAVEIETKLGLRAHRISAHRALSLNPDVPKISEQSALARLRTGERQNVTHHDLVQSRPHHRWNRNPATQLLNDFDYLIQALFADHIKTTHESHRRLQTGNCHDVRFSKFEELFKIWEELLPARKTKFDGDRISIQVPNSGASYAASEMSDGERAVFYLIGQTLLADKESALIIDEPELHLHPSIVTALWDQLAAKRPDCAFVFITHSLQFAASRSGQKFVIQSYDPTPVWELQTVDENTGFSEELTTLLLGTRRPVLFVEGAESSLDRIIYQAVYPDYLVLPCGSCDSVIHSVQSMKSNASFTRISCSGIVDCDHRSDEEIEYLHERGVEVLPVTEIENIVLLPGVSRAIAMCEGYSGKDLESCLNDLRGKVFEKIMNTVTRDKVVARHTIRRIDSIVKGIDLTGDNSIEEIERCFQKKTAELDISQIAAEFNQTLQTAVDGNDLKNFLKHWDDKNLLALAANQLKKCQTKSFKDWLERVLVNGSVPVEN